MSANKNSTYPGAPLRIRSAGARAIANSPDAEQLLSINQAAQYVGVCTKTVRNWIADNELPATRFGPKLIRIRKDDIDAMGKKVSIAA